MSQQVVPRFFFTTSIAIGCLVTVSSVQAQIIPDNTLPVNSQVTPGCTLCTINGGTVRGANLFHSFSEFGVPTDGEAFFNNGLQIQNIFNRVTSNSVSNIDGSIRANGTANLFLLNPNGIIFGQNATLNIGGSFFASTASSLLFADGTVFSAKPDTSTPPLLTISVPLGLQYGSNPGSIQVQGSKLQVNPGQTLTLVGGNVSLESGQLLAPGGRVELGGLAGEGTVGLVANGSELSLSFPVGVVRGDVSLSDGVRVDVTAGGGSINVNAFNLTMTQGSQLLAGIAENSGAVDAVAGNIDINATGAIDLSDSSYILNNVSQGAKGQGGDVNITTSQLRVSGGAVVSADTLGQGDGGNLTVNADKQVQLIGTSADGEYASGLYASAEPGSSGKAGDLTIHTGTLLVRDGAVVSAGTFGQGDGGNLTVHASKDVQLIGESTDGEIASGLYTQTEGTGNAGNLTITTGQLLVSDGAVVSTTTFGAGNAGSLIVNATDKVQVIGESADAFSGLFANSDEEGTGNAGDLTINTPSLLVGDGALVFAGNRGSGNSGNVTVNVFSLLVWGGAQVGTLNNGPGKGGTLIVNAADKVQLIGTSPDGQYPSSLLTSTTDTGNAGDLTITTGLLLVSDGAKVSADTDAAGNGGSLIVKVSEGVQLSGADSGLFVDATAGGTAGDLTVETRQMSIRDKAQVTVSSPLGQAGNLTIQANSLLLNGGKLLAETAKSDLQESGANINLLGLDLLRLDNESQISASAFDQAKGGNIRIESTFVVATPPTGSLGSDITANAVRGNGGRVNITTQGLFGIQLQPQLTPKNDITVSSQFGLTGEFQLNSPDVDPNRGLINLPTAPLDTEVSQACQAGATQNQNSFIITGRGGLPPNPRQVLRSRAVEVDWVTLEADANNPTEAVQNRETQRRVSRSPDAQTANNVNNRPPEIVEAQGWVIDDNGKVALVAEAPTATPHSSWQKPVECRTEEFTQ